MRAIVSCVILSMSCIAARAADWPQWRHDAARSGVTPEELPAELHLRWVREFPMPRLAWPGQAELLFDRSYEPVVAGKTMFVPCNVNDSVTALDTETGEVRWRFFAEGPVRFAPVAGQGKVYFASDDGCLYCLDAANGNLNWRFRGARVRVNGRGAGGVPGELDPRIFRLKKGRRVLHFRERDPTQWQKLIVTNDHRFEPDDP